VLGPDHDVDLVVEGLHKPECKIAQFLHGVAPAGRQEVLHPSLHIVAPHFDHDFLGEFREELYSDRLLYGGESGLLASHHELVQLHIVRVGFDAFGKIQHLHLTHLQSAGAVVLVISAGLDVHVLGGYFEFQGEARNLLGLVEDALPGDLLGGV